MWLLFKNILNVLEKLKIQIGFRDNMIVDSQMKKKLMKQNLRLQDKIIPT